MKTLHRIFAFVLVPILGYLLGATIFFHFWDKIEVGDVENAGYVAVAQSCERNGPVTYKGFGYWYTCTVAATQTADNATRTMTAGFLKPEHIGKEVAVSTVRKYREIVPEERPYGAVGMVLLFPFGILWLFVLIFVGGPVMPEGRTKRKMPIRYQKPNADV